MSEHEGIKEFQCNFCDRFFTLNTQLNTHIRKTHGKESKKFSKIAKDWHTNSKGTLVRKIVENSENWQAYFSSFWQKRSEKSERTLLTYAHHISSACLYWFLTAEIHKKHISLIHSFILFCKVGKRWLFHWSKIQKKSSKPFSRKSVLLS